MLSAIDWFGGELDFSPPAQLESPRGNQLNKLSTQHTKSENYNRWRLTESLSENLDVYVGYIDLLSQ